MLQTIVKTITLDEVLDATILNRDNPMPVETPKIAPKFITDVPKRSTLLTCGMLPASFPSMPLPIKR